jgi:lysophospholipase L1-like esterase
MSTLRSLQDIANIRSQASTVSAEAGSISIQNLNGVLTQVNDQGTATALGSQDNVNWENARVAEIAPLVPGLSYKYIPLANWALPATTSPAPAPFQSGDWGVAGGGISPPAGSYMTLTPVAYTNLPGEDWAWSFYGRFVEAADFIQFGPMDTDGGRYVTLVAGTSYDATHLILQSWDSRFVGAHKNFVTTHVIDGKWHSYTVCFLSSTGTVTVLVDGAVVLTTQDLSFWTAGLRFFACTNTVAGRVIATDLLVGYTRPQIATAGVFSFKDGQKVVLEGDSVFAGQPSSDYRAQNIWEEMLNGAFNAAGLAGVTYSEQAVGGSTTADLLARAATDIAAAPNHIVVNIGVNDFFNHGGVAIPPATSGANMAAWLAAIHAGLPNCLIHVTPPLWAGGELRPLGANANDGTVSATWAAIEAAALAAPTYTEVWDFRSLMWTSQSPIYNPANLATGALTQAGDGYHPTIGIGQAAWARLAWAFTTIGK